MLFEVEGGKRLLVSVGPFCNRGSRVLLLLLLLLAFGPGSSLVCKLASPPATLSWNAFRLYNFIPLCSAKEQCLFGFLYLQATMLNALRSCHSSSGVKDKPGR